MRYAIVGGGIVGLSRAISILEKNLALPQFLTKSLILGCTQAQEISESFTLAPITRQIHPEMDFLQ